MKCVFLYNDFFTYLLTPIFPNVRVREISGLMQARSLRCSGCLIQSSQYLNIHKNTSSTIIERKNKGDLRFWPLGFQFIPKFTSDHPTKSRKEITPIERLLAFFNIYKASFSIIIPMMHTTEKISISY